MSACLILTVRYLNIREFGNPPKPLKISDEFCYDSGLSRHLKTFNIQIISAIFSNYSIIIAPGKNALTMERVSMATFSKDTPPPPKFVLSCLPRDKLATKKRLVRLG
jgi:hypothetical protein